MQQQVSFFLPVLVSSHYELPFALLTLGTLIKQQLDSTLVRALTIATQPTASHTSHPRQKGAGIMVNSFKCILLSIVYLPFSLDALKTLLPLPLFSPSLSWISVYSVLCYPASTWKTEYINSCTSHLGPHRCALTPAPAATPASLAGAPGTATASTWLPTSPVSRETPCAFHAPSASEIFPRLYFSDLSFAENPTLHSLDITRVLSAMCGHVAIPRSILVQHVECDRLLQSSWISFLALRFSGMHCAILLRVYVSIVLTLHICVGFMTYRCPSLTM